MYYPKLLTRFPIISDQISRDSLGVVLRELETVLQKGIHGDIAEFGCYIGTTSLFLRRLLDSTGQSKERLFHVYDSFAGLPPKSSLDESTVGVAFQAGELQATKKEFVRQFQKAHLSPPRIHKGWFKDLSDDDLPSQIAFAFLDADFYESTLDSLRQVWPRLSNGGILALDDYGQEALPGVERATTAYFNGRPPLRRREHNIGILQKESLQS